MIQVINRKARLLKAIGYFIFLFFGFGIGYFLAAIPYVSRINSQLARISELSTNQANENVLLIEENKKLVATNKKLESDNKAVRTTTSGVCKQKRVISTAMSAHYEAVKNMCAAVPMNRECSWTGLSLNELKAAKIAIQGLSCP